MRPAAGTARRPRPIAPVARGRTRRRWAAAALAGLAAAALGADRVAAGAAEDRLAHRLAARQPAVTGTPQVTLGGFPFLVDAARGSFPTVQIRADAVAASGLPVEAAVGLRDVTERSGRYTAAKADARFTVPLDALASAVGQDTSVAADHGRLRLTRTVLGLPLDVTAEVRLADGTVGIRPVSATLAGRPLDPADGRFAAVFRDRDRPLPDLPAGLAADAVTVDGNGLTVHARAGRVTLT
ncbi:LmeA family phospholipid-binding protein [Kitasatospora sp. KL5]|uniref:LmeA family phospholipid-binding protein n=1 Tax=Kitasatospora sp. KL5 TaxID=3425125 RepID=UPI003D6E5AD3